MSRFEEFGANSGLVEELYAQYTANPKSVNDEWRSFFAASDASGDDVKADVTRAPGLLPTPAPRARAVPTIDTHEQDDLEGDKVDVLRGAAARVVENMEDSLTVPTATSVRAIPARLLEVNRRLLNDQLASRGSERVSFTHLIAFAIVRALREAPQLNVAYSSDGGAPAIVRHEHLNLGIAVDSRRRDGTRTLLVPNIKRADTLDFAAFWRAYDVLIGKVREGRLGVDDFAGTTATITNPGMIGTVHSIPRLLPHQGFIVGVGSIGPPAQYAGADPRALARIGVGSIVTLTNTYDHRVIGGAESGEFLGGIHDRLLGEHAFYDEVFRSMQVASEPARWAVDAAPDDDGADRKVVRVNQLVNMFRVRGHLVADLDPLGRHGPHGHPELDLAHHGLTIWDLDRAFPVDLVTASAEPGMTLREILTRLRATYAGTIGIEYMHIQEPEQKAWIQEQVEGSTAELTAADRARILDRLEAAESLERFLHTKYLGHKRFSLEGAETLIPMLDGLCSAAADASMEHVVLGMTHRGRLNVLTNLFAKPYRDIFRQFEGDLDPVTPFGTGDVKYHLGATATHTAPTGSTVELKLAANPSHLESVDPVVVGMARAIGDRLDGDRAAHVVPVLVHGDAAFAGQGVVAETLNLSDVPGYEVDGTVHIVINNQLGFTTAPEAGRSSVYPTDVAKMVQAPIFHVNADDPEAALRVTRLAFEFRATFRKDVVIDLFCYRRYGHSEIDEPAFTQPRMYDLIDAHPSVRALYVEALIRRGELSVDDEEAVVASLRARLADAYEQTRALEPPDGSAPPRARDAPLRAGTPPARPAPALPPAVDAPTLRRIVERLSQWPDGFAVHPKLQRALAAQLDQFDSGHVDWALAESLAFGSLLLGGTAVRLAGQDSRRGTFSQRHGVLVSQEDESEYVSLAHLDVDQAPFLLYDSTLSEYAALGFEYGYSVEAADTLVCWEAQYGDFANGAQIVIDQFVAAGADKWGESSHLTLLLPHGYEGQGPEHSSARIERFLQLSAADNLRVAYPSTAAQYFHLLLRQARDTMRIPLVCFTPKRYLRLHRTRTPVEALTDGRFEPVLVDAPSPNSGPTWRALVCTGMIAHELAEHRDRVGTPDLVVRIEELCPFPSDALGAVLDDVPGAVCWIQEEPINMGAASFVVPHLEQVVGRAVEVVGRPASASTATGSSRVHEREHEQLLLTIFGGG
jgi:2-oxoglutarate decarboxylase